MIRRYIYKVPQVSKVARYQCCLFSNNDNRVSNNSDIQNILQNGFTFFSNSSSTVVNPALCELILNWCMGNYENQSKTWKYKLSRMFDIVNTPKNRHSIKIKMTEDIFLLLNSVLYGDDRRKCFYENLYGKSSVLVELSLLLTFPGAPAQALHSDISYQALESQFDNHNLPGLSSTFVALQDVHQNMGPTIIIPNTHTKEYHSSIKIDMESYSVDGTIEKISNIDDDSVEKKTFSEEELNDAAITSNVGDVYTMDARAIHCGGANNSTKPRALICFAFQREDEDTNDIKRATGFTYHINDEVLQRKYRLSDFENV